MSKRRLRDKNQTVQDILTAAKHLFSERGLHGTSIRDVEEASGVSKGLILHHFGAKEKLYAAVQELLSKEYVDMMDAQRQSARKENLAGKEHLSENFQEMVTAGIRSAYLHTKGNRDSRRIALWSYLEGQERNTELDQGFTMALVKAMRAGQQAGLVREDIDAFLMPFMIKGAIEYWIQKEKLIQELASKGEHEEEGSDERLVEALAKLFLK